MILRETNNFEKRISAFLNTRDCDIFYNDYYSKKESRYAKKIYS